MDTPKAGRYVDCHSSELVIVASTVAPYARPLRFCDRALPRDFGGAGIGGAASLSCSGAPAKATCSVPTNVTVDANTQAPFTVSIATTPRTMGALHSPGIENLGWVWATTIMAWVVLGPSGGRKRKAKSSSSLLALGAMTLLILLICSCGSGSGGSQAPNGTPAGTYNLTVTATMGSNSQSTPLTLIVQ